MYYKFASLVIEMFYNILQQSMLQHQLFSKGIKLQPHPPQSPLRVSSLISFRVRLSSGFDDVSYSPKHTYHQFFLITLSISLHCVAGFPFSLDYTNVPATAQITRAMKPSVQKLRRADEGGGGGERERFTHHYQQHV